MFALLVMMWNDLTAGRDNPAADSFVIGLGASDYFDGDFS